MHTIQFVHEGLGNSSYLVGLPGGEAVLVDPDRNIDRYVSAAEERGWRISHVLESHVHADFVSGARELAWTLGAKLLLPSEGGYKFHHDQIGAGEKRRLGGVQVEAIASPGHTPEHLSYVIHSGDRHPPALFSGGALIVGGAARTDLISPELTDSLTRQQFRTLRTAFNHLPNHTDLFPTHGGGSFCSSGGATKRVSTLGEERQGNPLFQFTGEDAFADWFPGTFPAAPDYFFRMRAVNQAGPALLRDITRPPALEPEAFHAIRPHALVVDTRPIEEYLAGHVPGALSNAFRPAYSVWLGWLVPAGTPLAFVADEGSLPAVIGESLLVGYENFAGWLSGGMRAWEHAGMPVSSGKGLQPSEVRQLLADGAAALDVRENAEHHAGHIPGAIHIPLGELGRRADELPADRPVVAYCGHGERAVTATSILEGAGLQSQPVLLGGVGAWQEAGYQIGRPA